MKEKKKQPNILVICSDEHNPHFTSYGGHPYISTPNLDRLAQRGSVFNRAYCNCPVCTPSRMSFITGKYVHQIDNWMIGIPLSRDEMTWARRLKEAGIPSTMIGKMDFCGEYQDGGFSDYKIIEKRGTWEKYPRTSPLVSRLKGYIREDKREHIIQSGIRENIVTDGRDGHNEKLGFYDHDRIITSWACDYLKEKAQKKEEGPWALYVGLLYPHWPFKVPEKYYNMYRDKAELPYDFKIPENPNLHPAIFEQQKAQHLVDLSEEDVKRAIASYCGMITCMDDMIGEILTALEEGGMLEDTYIIYTSDHGESLGEHGVFYKQCAYDGSAGIPLIMAGPGIPENKTVSTPVTLVDMYPTIMDLAGLETEPDRYGTSWKKLACAEKEEPRMVFSEYHGNFFPNDWYMLIDDRYKYIYYINERPSLFDLVNDPQELNDLALDPEKKGLLEKYEKHLRELLDPEETSMRSKKDCGLISADGEDYTQTLTAQEALAGIESGRFAFEPEFVHLN